MATFTAKAGDDSLPPLSTLNEYFASVVQSTRPTALTVPSGCNAANSFQLSILSYSEVIKALSSIKSSTATGHEQIPGFVLQKLARALAPNFTIIYNSILQNNIIPKSWKMAQVRAIYKQKRSKNDPSNYRPISVLPILGRTLEKLVASHIHSYIPFVKIIPFYLWNSLVFVDIQAASWLFSAVDSWMDAVDKGHYVGALLLDFTKAFDSVPHQLLLTELQAIGCITDTITWFCNYLADREQGVITHEQITEWMAASRGFPQGSGLSPLLFNIFIRRLPRHCISTTLQFADDTTLPAADSSLSVVADNLTASFSCVKTFVKLTNWLSILPRPNLLFSNQWAEEYQTNFIFSWITVPLHHKRQLSYSVLLLISTTFAPHIENVVTKCHGFLGTLARATLYLPRQLLKLSYTAIIRSHLEYCSSLFTSAVKTHLQKLDTIQRIAARIIYEVPRDTHAEQLVILLNLEQLGDRRERHLVKLMNSFISGKCHTAMKRFNLLQMEPSQYLCPGQLLEKDVGDRCYYIQSVVCLLLRLRGIMNPISGLGTRS